MAIRILTFFVCVAAMGQTIDYNAGWNGAAHGPAVLTYSFGPMTGQLTYSAADNKAQVVAALNEWARHAVLTFSETLNRNAPRNLDLSFPTNSMLYGHGYPDGKLCEPAGGFLGSAHAAGPAAYQGLYDARFEPHGGDVHFNDYQPWIYEPLSTFYRAALHEIGHGLGLVHNIDPTSVMNPLTMGGGTLNRTDIEWIQAMYAPRYTLPPPPAPVITSFTATPSAVTLNFATHLEWATSGATDVSISGVGSVAATGDIYLYPQTTTTYTLTATNSGGSTTGTATVTVTQPPCQGRGCPGDPGNSLTITAPASVTNTDSLVASFSGTVTGGTAPYSTVTWTNPTAGTSGDCNGGSYFSCTVSIGRGNNAVSLRVQDASGAVATATVAVAGPPYR